MWKPLIEIYRVFLIVIFAKKNIILIYLLFLKFNVTLIIVLLMYPL